LRALRQRNAQLHHSTAFPLFGLTGSVVAEAAVWGHVAWLVEGEAGVGVIDDLLDHEGVAIGQAGLEQVETHGGEFLVMAQVGGDISTFAVVDEPVGVAPVLDHLQRAVDLSA